MAKKYYVDAAGRKVGTEGAGPKSGVAFDFSKDGAGIVVLQAGELPGFGVVEGTALDLLLHGISQKGGDSYANAKNQPNPVAWAVQQVTEVVEGLKKGVFNAGRTGDGTPRVSLLARAMHLVKTAAGEPSTEKEAQEFVDKLSKEQIAEYKSKKKIARAMDQIRLADAQAKLARAQAKAAAGGSDDDEDEDDAE